MMSSFLESSSSPNIISSLLKFSNPSSNQKSKPKPLTSLTIEQVRLKYLSPKPSTKTSSLTLPKIEQKNNSKHHNKNEKNKLNSILVDFSRHTIGSFGDFKNSWHKRHFPLLDSKTYSTCSSTSSHNENFLDKNFAISIDNFNLAKNLVDSNKKNLYKMDEDERKLNNKKTSLETNFRLQRLANGDHGPREKIDGKKSRLKSRKKKIKLRKISKPDSTNENFDSASSKSIQIADQVKMTRVDSPHVLKKSLPDSYKFVTHSSVCLGITSKDLVEQFEFYQSNSYSNEAKN